MQIVLECPSLGAWIIKKNGKNWMCLFLKIYSTVRVRVWILYFIWTNSYTNHWNLKKVQTLISTLTAALVLRSLSYYLNIGDHSRVTSGESGIFMTGWQIIDEGVYHIIIEHKVFEQDWRKLLQYIVGEFGDELFIRCDES